jgi:hypothetical protein
LKEATHRTKQKTHNGASDELRVVSITCKPAPDAQDRLRRLFTLLLELTAEESQPQPPAGRDASDIKG